MAGKMRRGMNNPPYPRHPPSPSGQVGESNGGHVMAQLGLLRAHRHRRLWRAAQGAGSSGEIWIDMPPPSPPPASTRRKSGVEKQELLVASG